MPPRPGDRGGGGGGRGGGGGDGAGSRTFQYRDFSTGLVRAGSRSGIPDTALWQSDNAQVIGPGQVLTLTDPATAIVSSLSPTVVSLWGVVINLSGTESSRLIAVRSDGSVSSVNPSSGALTTVCAAGVLTSAARVAMWRDTHVLFADITKGYASWDGTNFVLYPATFTATTTSGTTTITWTAGTPAGALVPGMDIAGTGIAAGTTIVGVAGTTITISANATASGSATMTVGTGAPTTPRGIEVFEGRVWLMTGSRGLTFTGPGSFTAFGTVYAGGVSVLTDPVFPGEITTLKAAMQLLWVVGPAAINTISNVQVVSGVTTFQNDNLVAGAGSPWANSVQPLFRTLVFLTHPGVYAILGATPQKLSDALDTLFGDVEGFGTYAPAGVFTLNNILVYGVMVTIAGATKLLVYSRPTWSVCDQGANLLWITTLVRTNGDLELWGTDGGSIFQCFAGTTGDFNVAFKHFDYGSFVSRHTARRVALEASTRVGIPDLQVYVENESSSVLLSNMATVPGEITFVNDSGGAITWINNTSGPITWIAQGMFLLRGEAEVSGNLIGLRLIGTDSSPLTLSAFAWEIGVTGEWAFEG